MNVDQPKFMQEVDRQMQQTSLARLENVLEVATAEFHCRVRFPRHSSRKTSRSTENTCAAPREMKPRWKRCVESTDR